MKTTLILLSLLITGSTVKSQSSAIAAEIRSLVQRDHPEISTADKILAVNIWSESDKKSRSCNQAFEKAYTTFHVSKLSGGRKGLIVVLLNKEDLTEFAIITLGKDGVSKSLSYKRSDLATKALDFDNNAVYDANNRLLYKELEPEVIFESFHSLITR